MSARPLEGVKVVEFGQNLAGPYCGQILAFLGAEVVKIERPEGDDARKWGPPFLEGDALGFIALNRGKKSITCDLGDNKQREALIERIGRPTSSCTICAPTCRPSSASMAQRSPNASRD